MSTSLHTHKHQNIAPETEGRTIRKGARYYDVLVSFMTLGRAATLRARTADLAELSAGQKVLDVGCGTGDLAREMRKRVGPSGMVTGIDASPEMIARARQKALRWGTGYHFRLEAIEALSFGDQTFDTVTASFVFHHLPDKVKREGLREVKRILKPGGKLLIIDFMTPGRVFLHESAHMQELHDIPHFLAEAGFGRISQKNGPLRKMGYVVGYRD